jgi:hypothetical protein
MGPRSVAMIFFFSQLVLRANHFLLRTKNEVTPMTGLCFATLNALSTICGLIFFSLKMFLDCERFRVSVHFGAFCALSAS